MSKGKILIVDDEPDVAEVIGDRLEALGFDVRVVNRARACFAAVEEDAPGLILMDIQMPEISGIEALGTLKTRWPEIPVLMITASTGRLAAEESIQHGASDFLLKPFEPADLKGKVFHLLNVA